MHDIETCATLRMVREVPYSRFTEKLVFVTVDEFFHYEPQELSAAIGWELNRAGLTWADVQKNPHISLIIESRAHSSDEWLEMESADAFARLDEEEETFRLMGFRKAEQVFPSDPHPASRFVFNN